MNGNWIRRAASLAALATLAGCATLDPQSGFEEVQSSIQQRVDKKLHWKRGGPEDEAVRAQVRELLQSELTLEGAVQVALWNNPRIQAMFEEIGIAQADLVQAGLLTNPVLEAIRRSPRGGGRDGLELTLSFDFFQLLSLPLRKAVAEKDYAAAKLRITGEIMSLASEVRQTFFEVRASAQRVELMGRIAQASDAALYARERLRAAGNVTELDLDRERLQHDQVRLQLADAEMALMQSRGRMNVLMGVWGAATGWLVDTRLPEPPEEPMELDNIEAQAVENNLELARLRLRMQAVAKAGGLANLESVLPDVEAGFVWEREPESGDWVDGPLLAVQIPLFDMGQAHRAAIKGELERLLAEYRAKAIQVRSVARLAALRVQQERARVQLMRRSLLPLTERVVAGMQLEYNAMQIGVFRLLAARERQIMLAQGYIRTLKDYWQARARVGNLIQGGTAMMAGSADSGMAAMSIMGGDSGGH